MEAPGHVPTVPSPKSGTDWGRSFCTPVISISFSITMSCRLRYAIIMVSLVSVSNVPTRIVNSGGSRLLSTSKRLFVRIALVSRVGESNLVTHGCRFGLPNVRLSLAGRVKPTAGCTAIIGIAIMMSLGPLRRRALVIVIAAAGMVELVLPGQLAASSRSRLTYLMKHLCFGGTKD